MTRLLGTKDVRELNRARTILEELVTKAGRAAGDAERNRPDYPEPTASDLGRLAQAAYAAEHGIFHVLNIANAYCREELTEQELHNKTPEPASLKAVPDLEYCECGAHVKGTACYTVGHRNPYVGTGADGARRSAAIDRDEIDTLAADDPRREDLANSAARWERQAAELEEA